METKSKARGKSKKSPNPKSDSRSDSKSSQSHSPCSFLKMVEPLQRVNLHRERRYLPRLSLTYEQFRLKPSGQLFSVIDLSEMGMGLWLFDPEDLVHFSVGGKFEGILNLKREKYEVRARVRTLYGDRVGCEFENLSPAAAEAIASYLNPSTLGQEFKLLPSQDSHSLWYHGPSGTDLHLRYSAGKLKKLQQIILYALGFYIQWDQEQGLSTGKVSPADQVRCGMSPGSPVRGVYRWEAIDLSPDSRMDQEKLGIAKTVVLSSNLTSEIKKQCMDQLNQR